MGSIREEMAGGSNGKPKYKRYVARWYDDGGVQRRRTFSRKQDAQGHIRRMEGDKERGEYHDQRAGKTPYRKVAEEWLDTLQVSKERTKQGYRSLLDNHVLPTFAVTPVGRITKQTVKAWVAERASAGVGPGTIRNAFRNVLKPSLDHAVDVGYVRSNPAIGVKLPKSDSEEEMLFLTAHDVRALADEITPPYGTLVLFAAYTGLRAGEVAALRVKNLDLMRHNVRVEESVSDVTGKGLQYLSPKTKTSRRTVPLPSFLVEPLTELIAAYAQDREAFVFRSPDGGPLRHSNFTARHFKPAVRRALPEHLHGLRFHDLRHTCAALMINLTGADPYNVMRRLGHSSITTTFNRYGHLFPERDAAITAGLEDAYFRAAETTEAEVVSLGLGR